MAFPDFFTRVWIAGPFSARGHVPALVERVSNVSDLIEIDDLERLAAVFSKLDDCHERGRGRQSAVERVDLTWPETLPSPGHLRLDAAIDVEGRWSLSCL